MYAYNGISEVKEEVPMWKAAASIQIGTMRVSNEQTKAQQTI